MVMNSKMVLKIKMEMLKKGWSQRRLAAASNVSLSAVSRLLKLRSKKPDTSTLQKLSLSLGIPLGELVEALD